MSGYDLAPGIQKESQDAISMWGGVSKFHGRRRHPDRGDTWRIKKVVRDPDRWRYGDLLAHAVLSIDDLEITGDTCNAVDS